MKTFSERFAIIFSLTFCANFGTKLSRKSWRRGSQKSAQETYIRRAPDATFLPSHLDNFLRLPTARRPRKIPPKNSFLLRKILPKKFRLTKIKNSKLRTLKALLVLPSDRRVSGERGRGRGRGCYAAEEISYVTPIFGLRVVTFVTLCKTLLLRTWAKLCYVR